LRFVFHLFLQSSYRCCGLQKTLEDAKQMQKLDFVLSRDGHERPRNDEALIGSAEPSVNWPRPSRSAGDSGSRQKLREDTSRPRDEGYADRSCSCSAHLNQIDVLDALWPRRRRPSGWRYLGLRHPLVDAHNDSVPRASRTLGGKFSHMLLRSRSDMPSEIPYAGAPSSQCRICCIFVHSTTHAEWVEAS